MERKSDIKVIPSPKTEEDPEIGLLFTVFSFWH